MVAKDQTSHQYPLFPDDEAPAPETRGATHVVSGMFAGIGGFELGLSRAGHETAILCENEPGAMAVLRERFPEIELHDDVTTLSALPPGTTLLVGGFPCQDLSQAGLTAGIEGARSGLVFELFRLLRRRPVPWVLLENVPFMLQLARGKALEVVIDEMERLGYRWAYRVVDSRAFGVPQRRQRVYLLASLEGDPRDVLLVDDVGPPPEPGPHEWRKFACGFYWTEGIRGLGWAYDAVPTLKGGSTIGIPSAPAIVRRDGSIVTPHIRDAERMQGFPIDWTLPAEKVVRRGHRWKLVGNAVTVDTVEWLGRRFVSPGKYDGATDPVLERKSRWPSAAWSLGKKRHVSSVSMWPQRRPRLPLDDFLRFPPDPLSYRAASGFLERARRGSLRFPPGFLETVEAHSTWIRERGR